MGRKEVRRFDSSGRSPLGQRIECRVYGLIADGWFVSLTSIAEPAVVERRERALLETVRTFGLGSPKADRELAGTWHSESFSSAGSVRNRLNTTTKVDVTLRPDGRGGQAARRRWRLPG